MAGDDLAVPADWPLSDREIHYLWWFIQGSIMDPGTRWRLRRAWGFCQRHAWGALAVEATFRHSYLHGPAVLYEDIMERALGAFVAGPWRSRRVARLLRASGPCLMCEMDLDRNSPSTAREALLIQGRDARELRAFAASTKEYWGKDICGKCLDNGSRARCRPHLVAEASRGATGNLDLQRALTTDIAGRVAAFSRSFVWGYRDTATTADRAGLISAVGWCSGWRVGLALIGLEM